MKHVHCGYLQCTNPACRSNNIWTRAIGCRLLPCISDLEIRDWLPRLEVLVLGLTVGKSRKEQVSGGLPPPPLQAPAHSPGQADLAWLRGSLPQAEVAGRVAQPVCTAAVCLALLGPGHLARGAASGTDLFVGPCC